MTGVIESFQEGGPVMYAILALGVVSLGIFIERFFYLNFKANIDKEKFISNVQRAILAGDLNSAVNYCNDRRSPLNDIVKAGLISVMNKGKDDEVQTAMDCAALREVPLIEKGTNFLSLFANLATLLGLLTTIIGMISAFKAVASVDPTQKASLLARSIGEAMNGTAFGLMVAIPSLLAFAFLSAKTQKILDDVQEISVSTLNIILQNRDKFPSRG